ncbi:hypothetical protein [Amycolatopsis anabasis]|uniref:hypothetical protein n=1 Tax=Amycolatopsis anabasis TaxID=1840409 RepID=UPI001FE3BD6D|nr:hypothetical protein [Amycolatopsis anabasis]
MICFTNAIETTPGPVDRRPGLLSFRLSPLSSASPGLTFLFGFGNVLNLALRLDAPFWGALLVSPAVGLSIPSSSTQLHPARRRLIFASMVALA